MPDLLFPPLPLAPPLIYFAPFETSKTSCLAFDNELHFIFLQFLPNLKRSFRPTPKLLTRVPFARRQACSCFQHVIFRFGPGTLPRALSFGCGHHVSPHEGLTESAIVVAHASAEQLHVFPSLLVPQACEGTAVSDAIKIGSLQCLQVSKRLT